MAIVHDDRVGRVRFKLAQMIAKQFPELKSSYRQRSYSGPVKRCVDPLKLRPQIPVYASPAFDCCSWDANLPCKEYGSYHIYSWDTMGELVKRGFDVTKVDPFEYELSAKQK